MNSNLTFHFNILSTESPPADKLKEMSIAHLKSAEPQLFKVTEGEILIQQHSHSLVNIALLEYTLKQTTTIHFSVDEPSLFMMVMLKGETKLYNYRHQLISETQGNSCNLTYLKNGRYSRQIKRGLHKLLVLTIKPELLILKAQHLTELQPLIETYNKGRDISHVLPHCLGAKKILRDLKILENKHSEDTMDRAIPGYLDDCIRNYSDNLLNGRYASDTLNKSKADELLNFVKENYTTDAVDNIEHIAKKLSISERNLHRLPKEMFLGRSFHQFVITYRMLQALKQIMLTRRSIKEIALSVGYDDYQYFKKAFKKEFEIAANEIIRIKF